MSAILIKVPNLQVSLCPAVVHKSGFNEARALISQTMLECYLHSRAKNLSGSRAPIDNYVLKGGYSNRPWGGKAEQKRRVAKRGPSAISIGSSGLSKRMVLRVHV